MSNTQTAKSNKSQIKPEKPSVIHQLLDIAAHGHYFHDTCGDTFVQLIEQERRTVWPIKSESFEQWLTYHYAKRYRSAPSKQTLHTLQTLLSGQARYQGPNKTLHLRVAKTQETITIALGDAKRQVVNISADGWRLTQDTDLCFQTHPHQQPLPQPQAGGCLDTLWVYLNVPESARGLVLAWILECFRADTPYPLLVLTGLQGSAKSTTQHFIRELIDPSLANLRSQTRKADDLLITARNNHLVSLNNLSYLSAQQQDDLCCLATGGGFSTRKLYSNYEGVTVKCCGSKS